MTERPIPFNGEMVRAILEGRKTQTRRLIRPQPKGFWSNPNDSISAGILLAIVHDENARNVGKVRDEYISCPLGVPGDRLWVRETWGLVDPASCDENVTYRTCAHPDGSTRHVVYVATGDIHEWHITDGDEYTASGRRRSCWKPSIHMPRWASRIELKVTNVRVEKLQNIDCPDIEAEGVLIPRHDDDTIVNPFKVPCSEEEAMTHYFAELWDSIYARRGFGWDADPWVWVTDFEVVRC